MSTLPKIDLPRYKHFLTGLQKEVRFRPFTVKEQKILLLAKETKEQDAQVEAIKQIIELCTFGDVNPDELPFFDVEDLFLRIRSKSVTNISQIAYKVKDTGKRITIDINLDDVKVTVPEGHTSKIMITDEIGLKMKYPTLEMLSNNNSKENLHNDDTMLRNSIDYVFTADEVFYFKDFTDQEVTDWIESFDMSVMLKIKEFFDTMPRLRHEVEITVNGQVETLKFEGLEDFFS